MGIIPIGEDFARMAIHHISTCVSLLKRLVAEGSRIFFCKSGDMLAGGLAIGTSATAPAVAVNPSNKGDIGEQANIAIIIDFNVSLCIGYSGKFFLIVIVCTSQYFISFSWNNYIIPYIRKNVNSQNAQSFGA